MHSWVLPIIKYCQKTKCLCAYMHKRNNVCTIVSLITYHLLSKSSFSNFEVEFYSPILVKPLVPQFLGETFIPQFTARIFVSQFLGSMQMHANPLVKMMQNIPMFCIHVQFWESSTTYVIDSTKYC